MQHASNLLEKRMVQWKILLSTFTKMSVSMTTFLIAGQKVNGLPVVQRQ